MEQAVNSAPLALVRPLPLRPKPNRRRFPVRAASCPVVSALAQQLAFVAKMLLMILAKQPPELLR
jgi:hypothetical protein